MVTGLPGRRGSTVHSDVAQGIPRDTDSVWIHPLPMADRIVWVANWKAETVNEKNVRVRICVSNKPW